MLFNAGFHAGFFPTGSAFETCRALVTAGLAGVLLGLARTPLDSRRNTPAASQNGAPGAYPKRVTSSPRTPKTEPRYVDRRGPWRRSSGAGPRAAVARSGRWQTPHRATWFDSYRTGASGWPVVPPSRRWLTVAVGAASCDVRQTTTFSSRLASSSRSPSSASASSSSSWPGRSPWSCGSSPRRTRRRSACCTARSRTS